MKVAGWKLIEINSKNDLLPSDVAIVSLISQAKEYLQQGKNWINIDIDGGMIHSKVFEHKVDLVTLRRI